MTTIQKSFSPKIEIALAILTGIGKFIFVDYLNVRLPFVLFALLFWIFYAITQARQNPMILHNWGFRTDNFRKVTKRVLPFGALAILASVTIGYFRNTIHVNWHILPILVIYPIWGCIQQFLIMGLIAGNLQTYERRGIHTVLIILISAVLFGLVHYPNEWLVVGTSCLAMYYSAIYLTDRNLYVLGLFHGWLAAIFYYTVLDIDPWIMMFGSHTLPS